MKTNKLCKLLLALCAISVLIATTSCEEKDPIYVPTIQVSKVGVSKAIIQSTQLKKYKSFYKLGVCWSSTTYTPFFNEYNSKYYNYYFTDTSATITIDELLENETYYVRAFAIDVDGRVEYGETVAFTTKKFDKVTDIEGTIYRTIEIGNRTWLSRNLEVKKFNDGSDIPEVNDDKSWSELTTGAHCRNNNTTYGILYNGYSVKTQKLCPIGWRVANEYDWQDILENGWEEFEEDEFSLDSRQNEGGRYSSGEYIINDSKWFWTSELEEGSNLLYFSEIDSNTYTDEFNVSATDQLGLLVRCVKY